MADVNTVPSQQQAAQSQGGGMAGVDPMAFWGDIMAAIPWGNPIVLVIIAGALMALTAVIVFVIYVWWSKRRLDEETGYETEPLEDTVKEDTDNVLDTIGASTDQPLRYNLRTIGQIYKMAEFSEYGDLKNQLETLSQDDDNNIDISEKSLDDLNEKMEPSDLIEEGVLDSEQAQKFEDDGYVPHRLLETRDRGFFNKLNWTVQDQILGQDKYTTYYLVPEPLIIDGGDHVQVPRNIQFRNIGGVEVPLYRSSMAILFSMVQRHGMEAALEDLENYSDRLLSADPEFNREIQKLAKRAELEDQGNNRGVAGDVNNAG